MNKTERAVGSGITVMFRRKMAKGERRASGAPYHLQS
jgi:hypothetical protein